MEGIWYETVCGLCKKSEEEKCRVHIDESFISGCKYIFKGKKEGDPEKNKANSVL